MSNNNRDDDLAGLLKRAADAAASEGIPSEAFMTVAWQAFLAAHPGMREELEDKALRTELKKLRKRGLIASA
ncbi:MAG TPA: hypothetical protein VMZ53_07810 [Kofleriaceae bacterium]|nr:hypothetical protein [Kofleriaceae bacterium]